MQNYAIVYMRKGDNMTGCECKAEYSIESYEENYALYYARCSHNRGHRLVMLVEPAWNFDPDHLKTLLDLGNAAYVKNPTNQHVAE
jgi:hypothetical protein